jgi:RNA polymerase sigma-70 factor (ECF subfamily)
MKENIWRRTLQSALAEERAIAVPGEFERIFRTHHGLVFRTAYRITGNAADAEDVSQIVFMRLYRRNDRAQSVEWRALENEESYLRRAAINAALDVIRSRQVDRTVAFQDLPEPTQDNLAHDDLTLDDLRELRQALVRALALLKPRSAEIFALRFLEGFGNPEIARMLGISQVLVAAIVHRTRQQLRRELGKYLGR